jgi:hypothetical protein
MNGHSQAQDVAAAAAPPPPWLRGAVREMLERAPAYGELDAPSRVTLARAMLQISSVAAALIAEEQTAQAQIDRPDNAMAESFFASLDCELIDRSTFRSKAEARGALFTYIEGWYNPRRRHAGIGYLAPAEFERRHEQQRPARFCPSLRTGTRALREPESTT